MDSTRYYEKKAEHFRDRTINKDMSAYYEKFFSRLPKRAKILDAGCGPGRDMKYFTGLGHDVCAFDASPAMCKMAEELTGIPVAMCRLEEFTPSDLYDGIWASASLLHVSYEEQRDVYHSFHKALKPGGILYASYKYGDSHRTVEERHFTDMNESLLSPILEGLFTPLSIVINEDLTQHAPSKSKRWIRLYARKA